MQRANEEIRGSLKSKKGFCKVEKWNQNEEKGYAVYTDGLRFGNQNCVATQLKISFVLLVHT